MATDLHILTITPFYPAALDDADGCFVAEPLPVLARAGVHHTVLAVQPVYRRKNRSGSEALADKRTISAEWVHYFGLPGGFGLSSAGAFLFARIVARVRELHQRHPIDLIHAHGPLPSGHAAMLLNAEMKIPFVVSVHGLDAFSTVQVPGRAGAWCGRISQKVYASSRRVICVSEKVRERVLEIMGRNCRTSVVYNGVDAEAFAPDPAVPPSPIVLSVGNLIPIKGHELLLRAVAAVSQECQGLSFEIIGDGPERARLVALADQLEISPAVHFLGRQSRRQVADAMRRCMVFALASRYEGLGCVYLEAMASGRPVIGCRDQGIAEIIQHGSNGFLVGPGNERELTLALGMLLRDANLRRNLGLAARETILDRLTLAHQAEFLARIYRECAG
jgi:teichuronic acid biosynthesis glycosyltransferase TuaC